MPYLDWKSVYSVGIETIDSQHQKLIGYMNAFYDSNAAANVSLAKSALNALVAYTKLHFSEEEALMAKHAYPEFQGHKKLHGDLLNLVQKLVNNYTADPSGKNADALSNFLKNWLVNHILGVDKKYVPFMEH